MRGILRIGKLSANDIQMTGNLCQDHLLSDKLALIMISVNKVNIDNPLSKLLPGLCDT